MDSNSYQTPDLASVLRTLAAYAPAPTQAPIGQEKASPYQTEARGEDAELEEAEYDPAATSYEPPPSVTPSQNLAQLQPQQPSSYDASLRHNARSHQQSETSTPTRRPSHPHQIQTPAQQQAPPATATPPPVKKTYTPPQYPPATIITWAPALRHVTTLTASNSEFTHRIKHLIRTQHQHEWQWWATREELTKRLHGRAASRSKLDSVLSSLGGKTAPLNQPDLPPEKELEIYDKKVYRACLEMAAATTKELAKLEVPFFCTMKGLVSGKGKSKIKGTITEDELVGLQKRMLELLEDLCGGEE
ncbi:hypothetical protein OEA41_004189 [Lepraria neglecta]|uniref:Uncharacterized protein n=1 Tax=Lepraria neglecta TaxID=209136 RepID=A0AAE0DJI2_9LECA|nr:hypothetical protein OEA41_004189 [Lepraria neglecta]